jgi:hypothetical protein
MLQMYLKKMGFGGICLGRVCQAKENYFGLNNIIFKILKLNLQYETEKL